MHMTTATSNVPNLDAMSRDDLMSFWLKYHRPGRKAVVELFPDRKPRDGSYQAVVDLACYASNKATAMSCRLRGDINSAMMYEGIADRIYDGLPEIARW
jgi:hypothetical protein